MKNRRLIALTRQMDLDPHHRFISRMRVQSPKLTHRLATGPVDWSVLATAVEKARVQWAERAKELEQLIVLGANRVPDDDKGWRFTLQQMKGQNRVTIRSALRFLNEPELLQTLNPFLTQSAQRLIFQWVQLWAQIESRCQHYARVTAAIRRLQETTDIVEQDSLARLAFQYMQENRVYDIQKQPAYLLFEVENDLLIRDRQLAIMGHVQGVNRYIGQLNMGEGKSTVIIPLLTVALAKPDQLVRLVVPAHLVRDMEANLKPLRSAFSIGVFNFPFSREVNAHITMTQSQELVQHFRDCRANRTVILMTPEQRLSLWLSIEERAETMATHPTADNQKILTNLFEIESLISYDILDEGDMVLAPNTELNYPIGHRVPMSGLPFRHIVAFDFIRLMLDPTIQNRLWPDAITRQNALETHNINGATINYFRSADAFGIAQRKIIAECLIDRYFGGLSKTARDILVAAVLPPLSCDAETWADLNLNKIADRDDLKLNDAQRNQLRGVRCWVGTGLPDHIFGQRYNVDYGLMDRDRVPADRYRDVAVPFDGQNTPRLKSTFAHPDVTIGLTILSYWYKGLTVDEVVRVVRELDRLPFSKHATFESWTGTMGRPITDFELDHPADLNTLTHLLKRQPDVIRYYLSEIVLGKLTDYNDKLSANAETVVGLASSSTELQSSSHQATSNEAQPAPVFLGHHLSGFSGTADQTMPRSVTDRMLIDTIASSTLGDPHAIMSQLQTIDREMYGRFQDEEIVSVTPISYQSTTDLLDRLIDRMSDVESNRVHAFLDRGALLTGMAMADIAAYLLGIRSGPDIRNVGFSPKRLPVQYTGVAYLDELDPGKVWVTYVSDGRLARREMVDYGRGDSDVLYLINDIATRGFNRKFPSAATGILTLDRDIPRDQLVQAAMRMRNWQKNGQKIEIWMPDEVARTIQNRFKISDPKAISALDVYHWALTNSLDHDAKNQQGRAAISDRARAKVYALKSALASGSIAEIGQAGRKAKEPLILPFSVYDNPVVNAQYGQIATWVGEQELVANQNYNVQAEVEVQVHQSEQAQNQPQVPLGVPAVMVPWVFESCLFPDFFQSQRPFSDSSGVPSIKAGQALFGRNVHSAAFSDVWITKNFWRVSNATTETNVNGARSVDAILSVRHATAEPIAHVIVSAYEAVQLKRVLLETPAAVGMNQVLLWFFRDPDGVSAISFPEGIDPVPPTKEAYLIASLINGDSAVLLSDAGTFFGQTQAQTDHQYRTVLSSVLRRKDGTPFPNQSYAAFKTAVTTRQGLLGRLVWHGDSPLVQTFDGVVGGAVQK